MKIWRRLKWNISSKALECRFSFSLFEAKLRVIFFISPIHPSMVQYSILKSNNLENEFFFSTRLGHHPENDFLQLLLCDFNISFRIFLRCFSSRYQEKKEQERQEYTIHV